MAISKIPKFSLQVSGENTFLLSGIEEQSTEAGESYFIPRPEPVLDSNLDLTTPEGVDLSDFRDIFTSRDANGNTRTFFLPKSGPVFEYNALLNSIIELGGMNDEKHYAVSYNGSIFFISESGIHYQVGGVLYADPIIVSTTLNQQFSTLNISVRKIIDVAVYQERVWLCLSQTIIWSNTNDIAQYLPFILVEGAEVPTNAGYQEFLGKDRLVKLGIEGRFMYLFLEDSVYSTKILDVNQQFGFNPLVEGVRYVGGSIATQSGLMFMSTSGLYSLQSEKLISLSENSNTQLQNILRETDLISSIEIDNRVYFSFPNAPDGGVVAIYNIIHDKFDLQPMETELFGRLAAPRETFSTKPEDWNDARGVWDNSNGGTLTQSKPVAVLTNGSLIDFSIRQTKTIRFNYIKSSGNRRVSIRTIEMPELTGPYRVRLRNQGSNNWGNYLESDSFRVVRPYGVYYGADIEVSYTENTAIRVMDIEADEQRV